MTVTLDSADPREMLSHFALYGGAALCEAVGVQGVRLAWTDAMASRPWLSGDGLTAERFARIVHAHAQRMAAPDSWLWRSAPHDPRRALMSPRLTAVGDDRNAWETLQAERWRTEDELVAQGDQLSLAFIAALGEPSSWSRHPRTQQRLQDHGASRLEMQPRNQGSEFVGNRLRGLAGAVAARTVPQVQDGLLGVSVVDEMGKAAPDSRTATNLRPPGPTDSALAWVALWGISQTTLVHRASPYERSRTATHSTQESPRRELFTLPLWRNPWTPAKLRSVLAGPELARAAELVLQESTSPSTSSELAEVRRTRGIEAVAQFPVQVFGSTSAPERRAMGGTIVPLPDSPL